MIKASYVTIEERSVTLPLWLFEEILSMAKSSDNNLEFDEVEIHADGRLTFVPFEVV